MRKKLQMWIKVPPLIFFQGLDNMQLCTLNYIFPPNNERLSCAHKFELWRAKNVIKFLYILFSLAIKNSRKALGPHLFAK